MIPVILLLISSITHFVYFGFPAEVVFDEVHYGYFMSNYWNGTFFFDVHPPLANIIFFFFSHLFNFVPGVNFGAIGNALPESFILLRLIPMICGIMLTITVYAICRRIGLSKLPSVVAGLLISFENSLIVQSRFVLPDMFLVFFGFLSILMYLEYRNRRHHRKIKILLGILSLVFATAAFSVKWTGLSFILLISLMELYSILTQSENRKQIFQVLKKRISITFIVCFIVYFIVFMVHFALTPKTGPGNPFMTERFQKTLENNKFAFDQNVKAEYGIEKFFELNRKIMTVNTEFNATHQYSSAWYSWPFTYRTVFYWQSATHVDDNGQRGYIYLLGNPIIYWLGIIVTFLLFVYVVLLLMRGQWQNLENNFKRKLLFVLIGFAVNFLPFILIDRVMFLYHYESALVFTIIAIGLFIDTVPFKWKKIVYSGLIVAMAFSVYLYFAPLTYGTKITNQQLNARMWFGSWR